MSEISKLNGYDLKDKKSIRTYDTVALMKSDTTIKEGQHIKTRGYYSINDSGSCEYIIESSENNLAYQEELNNGLYATLIIKEYVTPEMLGAYGDGTHDDTLSIQNLFSLSDKILFNSEKTYRTTSVITVPSNKYIDMNNSTILYEIETDNTNNKVFSLIDVENVVICNGKIRTDYLNKLDVNSQVIGIYLGGTKNCEIYNMDIGNCGGPLFPSGTAQIYIGVTDNNHADKNYIHDCIFGGEYDSFNIRVYSPYETVSTKEAKNNVIERCKFSYAHKSCVEIAGITTHDNIVNNCEVIDCGTEAMDIDKTSYNNTIKNVVVHNCSGSDEVVGYVPFGGISIQHRDSSDAVSEYYSHDNIVENCVIENTVGCGFYTNTQYFKFINCICKNALKGMFISGVTYPSKKLPIGSVIGCELHGTDYGIQFNRPGDVTIDNCKIYGAVGVELISSVSDSTDVIPKILNSKIHYSNKGIYTQVKNIDICENTFYDDITPLNTSSSGGIFASKFAKLIIDRNHFIQTTIRDINAYCNTVADPSILLVITNNLISSSTATAKINVTGDKLNVGNFIGNSILPTINANLVIDKTYD